MYCGPVMAARFAVLPRFVTIIGGCAFCWRVVIEAGGLLRWLQLRAIIGDRAFLRRFLVLLRLSEAARFCGASDNKLSEPVQIPDIR